MPTSCVYCITNVVNHKTYIGSTVDFVRRKARHLYELRRGVHSNHRLQKDFDDYGEDCFHFRSVENVSTDYLIQREQAWIDANHPEYNLNQRAGDYIGPNVHSEEAIEKSRAKKIGKKQSQETIAKRVATMQRNGKHRLKRCTEEQKQHLSEINRGENNPNFGLERTEEHKAILMDNITPTVYTFQSPENGIFVFRNLEKFALDFGVNPRTLRGAIRSPNHRMRGWEFIRREHKNTTWRCPRCFSDNPAIHSTCSCGLDRNNYG